MVLDSQDPLEQRLVVGARVVGYLVCLTDWLQPFTLCLCAQRCPQNGEIHVNVCNGFITGKRLQFMQQWQGI
jgi:hypothetical protein